jgi:hypothetical protein
MDHPLQDLLPMAGHFIITDVMTDTADIPKMTFIFIIIGIEKNWEIASFAIPDKIAVTNSNPDI